MDYYLPAPCNSFTNFNDCKNFEANLKLPCVLTKWVDIETYLLQPLKSALTLSSDFVNKSTLQEFSLASNYFNKLLNKAETKGEELITSQNTEILNNLKVIQNVLDYCKQYNDNPLKNPVESITLTADYLFHGNAGLTYFVKIYENQLAMLIPFVNDDSTNKSTLETVDRDEKKGVNKSLPLSTSLLTRNHYVVLDMLTRLLKDRRIFDCDFFITFKPCLKNCQVPVFVMDGYLSSDIDVNNVNTISIPKPADWVAANARFYPFFQIYTTDFKSAIKRLNKNQILDYLQFLINKLNIFYKREKNETMIELEAKSKSTKSTTKLNKKKRKDGDDDNNNDSNDDSEEDGNNDNNSNNKRRRGITPSKKLKGAEFFRDIDGVMFKIDNNINNPK